MTYEYRNQVENPNKKTTIWHYMPFFFYFRTIPHANRIFTHKRKRFYLHARDYEDSNVSPHANLSKRLCCFLRRHLSLSVLPIVQFRRCNYLCEVDFQRVRPVRWIPKLQQSIAVISFGVSQNTEALVTLPIVFAFEFSVWLCYFCYFCYFCIFFSQFGRSRFSYRIVMRLFVGFHLPLQNGKFYVNVSS